MVHIRFFHHIKELPGVGGQAFDIASLPFRIDRIEGQRRLARARQAGDHHQLVARDVHIHGFQIMLTRTAYFDKFQIGHGTTS